MRTRTLLDDAWRFTKQDVGPSGTGSERGAGWQDVALPHTWNALDGQDGGNDYFRGRCWYRRLLPVFEAGRHVHVEFEAANHIARVFLNDELLVVHEGGFTTFRINLTPHLRAGDNWLDVSVDNGESHVYPQIADFTFFGGLYRDAWLIETGPARFALGFHGTGGVFVLASPDGRNADVRVRALLEGADGCRVRCALYAPDGEMLAVHSVVAGQEIPVFRVENAAFWDGPRSPSLHSVRIALLDERDQVVDEVSQTFGIRSFQIDPDEGFFLNGRNHPLRGASRHQDRQDFGWAVGAAEHAEDMALLRGMGANAVRLAHYPHAQEFLRLCDEAGVLVWAEIPLLSIFDPSPEACGNARSQLTEMILQNANHPSVFCWGLSNEITIGDDGPDVLSFLRELDALARRLDPSRPTTIGNLSQLPVESPHNEVTDLVGYNLYFGWYGGQVEMTGPWLDEFHRHRPDRPLALSEYGAEGLLAWHAEHPVPRDYTEEYHLHYHAKMIGIIADRPWLWATFAWNAFDFAADARDEGGCRGRNNKGLVTYDRRTCKDAYFVYKAAWTDAPFVHVAGRRFRERVSGTTVRVCSNAVEVMLEVNGRPVATKIGSLVFEFEGVELAPGENEIRAVAGACDDRIVLVGVPESNPAYVLPQKPREKVRNWFEGKTPPPTAELRFPEGFCSIRMPLRDLLRNPEADATMTRFLSALLGEESLRKGGTFYMQMRIMKDRTLEAVLAMAGDRVPPEAVSHLNERLNRIPMI